jgi:Uma2 family endonuclease
MSVISSAVRPAKPAEVEALPPLEQGEHLDQPTFHARYEAMPPGIRAELIGGRVYLRSPVRIRHGSPHVDLATWLGTYRAHTPGVQAVDNTTAIFGDDSEPQPDASLRILNDGQTQTSADDYIVGCPELVCEVASSSASYDLHEKLADYDRYGAKEYIAVLVRTAEVRWFRRDAAGRLVATPPDADGIFRSGVFPGLWLDAAALVGGDAKRALEVLSLGLATPEHAAFAAELARRVAAG